MATAQLSLRNKLEEELECSLCLDRLEDPRVFPQCQHSFCYKCIVDLSQGKSKIFCPECRAEVEIGIPSDLSHFKRNTRINNILECMNNNNLLDSINPEITIPTWNDGTLANVRNTEESEVGTSADEEQPEDALHVEDIPPSASQTSKDIAVMEPAESSTSTNFHQMTNISLQSELDIGSTVEVLSKNQQPRYGIIRWIGFIPNSDKKIAGLELEEEWTACTDGTFLGKRYFTCPNRRGFFIHLHNCLPDSRFQRNFKGNTADKHLTKPDPRSSTSMNPRHTRNTSLQQYLEIGSMVEVVSKHGDPKYGVIRWIGFIPDMDKKIAGLELEEEMAACTDGTFLGKRYFTCPNRRGFFVHFHNCLPDARFERNSIENLFL